MIRVNEYKEIVEYIKDSYNYLDQTSCREFLETEEITVKLTISGLTRKGASKLKSQLVILGIASPSCDCGAGVVKRETESHPYQSEQYCLWTEDDDGVYQTSCLHSFEFMNGNPELNGMKFCPYCGRLVRQESEP